MQDCIFCKIVRREIPADIILENEHVLVFRDISPQAPKHLLIIPKKHIRSLNDVTPEDGCIGGQILKIARQIAQQEGIAQTGYRVVINTEKDSGWGVEHLHCHVLGGKSLGGRLVE